jgi:hypothetical protein
MGAAIGSIDLMDPIDRLRCSDWMLWHRWGGSVWIRLLIAR